jgi:hypothetical protein
MFCEKVLIRLSHTSNDLPAAVFGTIILFRLPSPEGNFGNGQETPFVAACSKIDYLRFGNVKLNDKSLTHKLHPIFSFTDPY